MLSRISKEIERASKQVVHSLYQTGKIVTQYIKYVATETLKFFLEVYFEIEDFVSKLLGGCLGIIYALRVIFLLSLIPIAFFYAEKPVVGSVSAVSLLGITVYAFFRPNKSIQVAESAAIFFVLAARYCFRAAIVLISIAVTYFAFSEKCQSQALFQCGVKRLYVAAHDFVYGNYKTDDNRISKSLRIVEPQQSQTKSDAKKVENESAKSRNLHERGYLFAEMLPISYLVAKTNTALGESEIKDIEQYFRVMESDFRKKRSVNRLAFNLIDEQEIDERLGRIATITGVDEFLSEVEKNGLLNAATADEMANTYGAKGKYGQARILSLHAVSVGLYENHSRPEHWISLSQAEFGFYSLEVGDELLAEKYAIGVFIIGSHMLSAAPGFCEALRRSTDSKSSPIVWRSAILKWRSRLSSTSDPVLHRCLA